jgi:hypothetical protein
MAAATREHIEVPLLLELKLATSGDCYLRGLLANITDRASTFIDRPVKRKQCGSCARSLSCHAPEAVAARIISLMVGHKLGK